jgi:hypothetical protein
MSLDSNCPNHEMLALSGRPNVKGWTADAVAAPPDTPASHTWMQVL